MSGALIAGGVIAAGGAVAAAQMQKKSAEKAANSMINNVQTFDPIQPNAPMLMDWRRFALDANNYNFNHLQDYFNTAGRINRFNVGQARQGYQRMQPYFDSLQRQVGANALSFARGQLPADVVASIGRAAAQRGIQSGFGQGLAGAGAGTPIANLNLRNLGLTSLDLSKFGSDLAMRANQNAAALTPALFRPESLMISPMQAIGFDQQQINTQNEAARYWNQLQNQALLGNVQGQNRAQQMATETRLAGSLAQAQAVASGANALGGVVGGLSTSGMGNNQTMGQGTFGASYIPGAQNVGSVQGFGYVPGAQGGYYRLS